jgi:cytochrome c556
MNKLKLIIYSALILMTGSVTASQVTIDEDYMQVMEDRQKSLSSNLSLKNAQAALGDAKSLEASFSDVEEFYNHKSTASDAVNWSRESRDLTVAIEKYIASNDFDTASQASATLAKTCKTCHRIYKKDA